MTKENLIKFLREGIRFESSVPVYLHHLSAIITQSNLPDEDVLQVKTLIDELIGETKRHITILENLLKRTQEESIDVY